MEVASKNVISHLLSLQRNETFSFAAFWVGWTRPHCGVFDFFFFICWCVLSCSLWLCLLALPIFVIVVISGGICMCVSVVESSLQILITTRIPLASVPGAPRHRPSSWLGVRHKLAFPLANRLCAAVDLPQRTSAVRNHPLIASCSESFLMHGKLMYRGLYVMCG